MKTSPHPLAEPSLPLSPALPGMPTTSDGPVFAEPWQAQAFAMTLALHQKGLFTWVEWAQALADQISLAQAAGDADHGDTYYRHWLAALELLVTTKGASTRAELAQYQRAWDHAADRTPHGQPITLVQGDFGPQSGALEVPTPPGTEPGPLRGALR